MFKKTNQNNTDVAAGNNNNKDVATNDVQKIGLKKPKVDKSKQKAGGTDDLWGKVDSIVSAAKDAYQSGSSDFDTIVAELIATLQSLREEEAGKNGLGGLGVGGPQMDIPEGEAPASDQNQNKNV
jgi:hypothetical protein